MSIGLPLFFCLFLVVFSGSAIAGEATPDPCTLDTDCVEVQAVNDRGCFECRREVHNLKFKQRPLNPRTENCPIFDCYFDPAFHPACVKGVCVLVGNTKKEDCPGAKLNCLYKRASTVQDCVKYAKDSNDQRESNLLARCILQYAQSMSDCKLIVPAYEREQCIANKTTKISDCRDLRNEKWSTTDPNNYQELCLVHNQMARPDTIEDCNTMLTGMRGATPFNCINSYVRRLKTQEFEHDCLKLKSKDAQDYCLRQKPK